MRKTVRLFTAALFAFLSMLHGVAMADAVGMNKSRLSVQHASYTVSRAPTAVTIAPVTQTKQPTAVTMHYDVPTIGIEVQLPDYWYVFSSQEREEFWELLDADALLEVHFMAGILNGTQVEVEHLIFIVTDNIADDLDLSSFAETTDNGLISLLDDIGLGELSQGARIVSGAENRFLVVGDVYDGMSMVDAWSVINEKSTYARLLANVHRVNNIPEYVETDFYNFLTSIQNFSTADPITDSGIREATAPPPIAQPTTAPPGLLKRAVTYVKDWWDEASSLAQILAVIFLLLPAISAFFYALVSLAVLICGIIANLFSAASKKAISRPKASELLNAGSRQQKLTSSDFFLTILVMIPIAGVMLAVVNFSFFLLFSAGDYTLDEESIISTYQAFVTGSCLYLLYRLISKGFLKRHKPITYQAYRIESSEPLSEDIARSAPNILGLSVTSPEPETNAEATIPKSLEAPLDPLNFTNMSDEAAIPQTQASPPAHNSVSHGLGCEPMADQQPYTRRRRSPHEANPPISNTED